MPRSSSRPSAPRVAKPGAPSRGRRAAAAPPRALPLRAATPRGAPSAPPSLARAPSTPAARTRSPGGGGWAGGCALGGRGEKAGSPAVAGAARSGPRLPGALVTTPERGGLLPAGRGRHLLGAPQTVRSSAGPGSTRSRLDAAKGSR